ncbi:unnamed protein product [Lepeophtheirus salmonis]|uniref:(salmon louse) hypothetical protein n=1 Tax=Lepeophtheirus salmonis TaxID=72036 RepID=A0A0K2TZD1_LEPSM|nr:uncharacterized protein LOC121122086 [Lepeophtheirus salmonis]CAB4067638.1 unnamed protein product [Lepeophtheirus salmonis]CAF2992988.1 unnamed protein product [Lepeophtheirus salmonis]
MKSRTLNHLVIASVLLVMIKTCESIKCYLDTKGIYVATSSNSQYRSNDNIEKGFKKFDCNMSGSGSITACMTKTSPDGLITRNCAPAGIFESGDCAISAGRKICFCTTDYCNGMSRSSWTQLTLAVLLISTSIPSILYYTSDSFYL